MKELEKLTAYEILYSEQVAELNSRAVHLRHKKTGARIALLCNDDKNKVFYIGFRTPPTDSTGVAHIIEHTVLCGSEHYPVKDPFIELAKGSLNTFLNAMTYPDKTVYPVASCNDKDFRNLMDVYLDAVFHPNIYREEKIFRQEGWHYEMETPEDELKINGVVYNEMKGAFSSPDDVLARATMNSLFPNTTYGVESGGDPDAIPDLTYEDYLAFHSKYYHPSNSYIFLYGDMDFAERLEYLDREYLGKYDFLQVDSAVRAEEVFSEPVHITMEYPVMEDEKTEKKTYLTYNVALRDNLDRKAYLAFQILDYALCSSPGAPLKKALIDAGIGHDAYSEYDNGIMQPVFSVVAKDADAHQLEQFVATVESVLAQQAKDGLNKRSLLAGLNYYEFKYRESDYGSYPKGLLWGLQMLDSWLYAEDKPFHHLIADDTFEELRKELETGYYEQLITDYLLNNPHKSILVLAPVPGLTTRKEEALAEKLANMKAGMTASEIDAIVSATAALKEYQESPDAPELLETIPLLSRSDIERKADPFVNEVKQIDETVLLYHPIFTGGIGYVRFLFDMKKVPQRLLPYAGVLKAFLGLLDTEQYSYGELYNETNIMTGGILPSVHTYTQADDREQCKVTFELSLKVLNRNLKPALDLVKEILLHTDYSDVNRLRELMAETLSHMQAGMMSSGHLVASGRALSYLSKTAWLSEQMSGIAFLRFMEELNAHFEDRSVELIEGLKEVTSCLFRTENLMVDFTGDQDSLLELSDFVRSFRKDLFADPVTESGFEMKPEKLREGFMSAGQVQYVCRAGNFRSKGLEYTGVLRALKVMMGYDYLWNNVRVKGGAYGCMCSFSRSGDSFFVSYRDPNLQKTIRVYEEAAEYIASYEAGEREITQFIIGAISDLDVPKTPNTKGAYARVAYLTNTTFDMIQKEREELLDATAEDLRDTAKYVRAFMEDDCLCVVGTQQQVQDAGECFEQIEQLLRG